MENETAKRSRNFKNAKAVVVRCLAVGVAVACALVAVRGIAENINGLSGSGLKDAQVSVGTNSFSMIVNAQELANGVKALTSKGYGGGVSVSANREEKKVSYSVRVPLQCTGNNISKVTYSINNGAFIVKEKLDERVVVGGVSRVGMDVPYASSDDGISYTESFYTMFTLDYSNQGTDTASIYICNVVKDDDLSIIDNIWADSDDDGQKEVAGYTEMFGDTAITCIVEYTDGSAESKQIELGNIVTTWNELGQPERAKEDPNEPVHFVTYELNNDASASSYIVARKFVKPSDYADYDVVALSEEGSREIAKNTAERTATYDNNGNAIYKKDGTTYTIPLYEENVQGLYDLERTAAHRLGGEEAYYIEKTLAEQARPSGTTFTDRNTSLFLTQLSSKRCITKGDIDATAGKWSTNTLSETVVENGFYIYNTEDNIAFEKCDVMSYSFALYEDIQNMAGVKFSLYGVTQENLDNYLYTKDKIGYIDYDKETAYADYLAGKATMTEIGSWDVKKTGVYYVDFSAIPNADSYVDYVVVVEMENYSDELSFRISADFSYDITDPAEFAKWKKENKSAFFEN
jgi:hypothetical protein